MSFAYGLNYNDINWKKKQIPLLGEEMTWLWNNGTMNCIAIDNEVQIHLKSHKSILRE